MAPAQLLAIGDRTGLSLWSPGDPIPKFHNSAAVPAETADAFKINHPPKGNHIMLMTIAIILLILWALGLVTSTTMGGLIHILIVVAIVIILVRVIQGRRVV